MSMLSVLTQPSLTFCLPVKGSRPIWTPCPSLFTAPAATAAAISPPRGRRRRCRRFLRRRRRRRAAPMSQPPAATPTTDLFRTLTAKADRRFSRVRDLPRYGRSRDDADLHKAFNHYTLLWKLQQEHRQQLTDAGLKRWEIGEIASRIAQLYYSHYLHTADAGSLAEAYIFYEAVLTRDYFGEGAEPGNHALVIKKLRFLARFVTVCLVLGRRDMVSVLVMQLRMLVDSCKLKFKDTEFMEWKHVIQEIVRFLKVDTPFMNMRPLRYSYSYDSHPDSLSNVASSRVKRHLVLCDALLSSYCHNEVKFMELTLDTFRMLQCLEWDPRGSFSLENDGDSSIYATGPNRLNPSEDIRDPSLPPNPRKVVLYRPSITHFLMVLATICEELPPEGILFIYLSAAGESGFGLTGLPSSGISTGNTENIGDTFPQPLPTDGPNQFSFQNNEIGRGNHEACLWLGARGTEGSKYLYPSDLIPFTRKPLFLVIDSNSSHAFKVIHGIERGEMTAMLLSPRSLSPAVAGGDSAHFQNESQFTAFLTAPVQAFCSLIGICSINVDKEKYNEAEKLLSLSLSEWEINLLNSDSVHPAWVEVLGDPLLRRFLFRFIFCRAVLALYSPAFQHEEFLPSCLPHLPESVHPENQTSQAAVMRLANLFSASNHFVFTDTAAVLSQLSLTSLK